MTWREWLKDGVDTALNGLLAPEVIFGAGSITGKPAEQFVVINAGSENEELSDGGEPIATSKHASIWVHDDSGEYDFIDSCLLAIRQQLVGPVTDVVGGNSCVWEGDSGELADDYYDTLTRNTNYRLIGRVA